MNDTGAPANGSVSAGVKGSLDWSEHVPPISDNARQVIEKRYSQKDEHGNPTETWYDIVSRVVGFVANAESDDKKYQEFYLAAHDLLMQRKFIPNTPCLVNAGVSAAGLAGCYVLPVPDSIVGIMKAASEAAIIHQGGGGTGFSFETLRPQGALVRRTHGVASGPVSFMEVFDKITDVVKQGGVRRGANMGIMRCDHPDILRFIHAKNNQHALTNFNISVTVTDEFMAAVDSGAWVQTKFAGKDWTEPVFDPMTGSDTTIVSADGKIYAPAVWQRIVESAHEFAEPGVIFIDTINRHNLLKASMGDIIATNPCQPGFAPLLTPDGIRPLSQINEGDLIWSESKWTQVIKKWSTGVKPVYAYHTNAGVFYGTDNHRVITNGVKIEVQHTDSIDRLTGYYAPIDFFDPQVVVDGLVLGDGFPHKASNSKVVLLVGDNDSDYFKAGLEEYIGEPSGISKKAFHVSTTLTVNDLPRVWLRRVPEKYLYGTPKTVASLLRGLFSANGSVVDNRITLKTTSYGLLRDVQFMLSALGIGSYFTTNAPTTIEHSNGVYTSKESYDLNVSTDREKFLRTVGFIQDYKTEKVRIVKPSRIKTTYDITRVECLGEMEVFDLTVDNETHTYWTGGLNVSNCAEQALHAYNSCNLGSIDVAKFFVSEPNSDNPAASFDWDGFGEAVYWGVRFLDNVIDVGNWSIPEIADVVKRTRPVGLGIMGFADLLLKLKITYGSEESIRFLDGLTFFFQHEAWKASCEIGKEKGAFPEFEKNKDAYIDFLWNNMNLDDLTLDQLDEITPSNAGHFYPRNYEVTTIAPTGTISLVAETSSGIEPNFAWETTRRDTVSERHYYHPMALEALRVSTEDKQWSVDQQLLGNNTLPDYFVTAHDLTAEQHLRMLAAAQAHIDNGVSKTCNAHKEDTVESVDALYRLAHKLGVKAVSYYRDGSRDGQVLTRIEDVENKEDKCPQCGGNIIHKEGCVGCESCDFAACTVG